MPGVVETVCTSGYGYVDPYIQKGRNAVPLFEKAAQRIEYHVPPLIKQVDQFAEPRIEKLKPKVEPIYNKGVEKAEELKGLVKTYNEGGVKGLVKPTIEPIYNKGMEKVEPIYNKGVEKAEELKGFVKPKVEPIYNKGVEKAGELKGRVKTTYEGGVKYVDKAKEVVAPYCKGGAKCAEDIREDIQQLVRVPARENLQDLKTVSTVSKFLTCMVAKVESLIDRYLPAPPSDADTQSDDSFASDKSALLPRMSTLPFTLLSRLVFTAMLYVPAKEDLSLAKLKAKVPIIIEQLKVQASSILVKAKAFAEPKLEAVLQTSVFKTCIGAANSTAKVANAGSEKLLGKEKTQAYLARIEGLIPVSCKPALSKIAKAA